ncbi:hypothetical protein PITC_053510 [Penicillium italicum]|uniref:Uncharacterized protein n=1 Tax=Penicillium italicum TaxID=40296 RepID=A0A0A2KMD2_PENIT|nr:hypothetical protein PITC_053510 [Penicillium italicum]
MRLPLEILQLILREAADALPYRDILRSRLVNSVFNEVLWPASANLVNKAALFKLWPKFPYRRKFIWQLIEDHKERPCFFSELIQDILDMPRIAPMSDEERHILIDKMIDAVLRSTENPKTLFSPHRYRAYVKNITYTSGARIESLELTLTSGLASSAILRGDHMELQSLIDQGVSLMMWSRSLGMVPVDLAYKEVVAARRGDPDRLEAWIKPKLEAGRDISVELYRAVEGVLRIGKVEMVGVLEKYITRPKKEMQWLWFYCYNEAIKSGMLHVVRWLLSREGSSLAKWTSPWHKTPLFIALYDCPSQMKLEMVQLLLENGVDPSGRGGLEIAQTPLQRAIQNGDSNIAMLLLKWGADPNTVARRTPPLHMAIQRGHIALVRCLFEHGARSRYQFKGKKYTVRQEAAMLKNIATVLEELGFDRPLIHEEYLILD